MNLSRSPSVVIALAVCLAISLFAPPTADALIIEELQAIQAILENLWLGVVGDLQRVRRVIDAGSDYVKELFRSGKPGMQRDIVEASKNFDEEFKKQMRQAGEAAQIDIDKFEKEFDEQVENAERSFDRKKRSAERQAQDAADAQRDAERDAAKLQGKAIPAYDAESMKRQIEQQQREYERLLKQMQREQERAAKQFQKSRNTEN